MSTRVQTQAKAASNLTTSFIPVPTGLLQRKCACGGSAGMSGECTECGKKRLGLQRSVTDQSTYDSIPPSVHEVLRSPGQPLEPATRAFFESRFGHDFSQVQVHTDARAAESARAVNALAYTVGRDVVFGEGQYQPRSPSGRVLIAHELAHIIQQEALSAAAVSEDASLERAADKVAVGAMFNRQVKLSSASAAPPIQFLKVTQGALGKALEIYTTQWSVPDKAVRLLQKSPTFMKLAAVLDRNYVWRGDSYKVDVSPETGSGRAHQEGPFQRKTRAVGCNIWQTQLRTV